MKTILGDIASDISVSTRSGVALSARLKLERQNLLLSRIEAALSRIASGQYGYCVYCHGDISLTLLERDPTISDCGKCSD